MQHVQAAAADSHWRSGKPMALWPVVWQEASTRGSEMPFWGQDVGSRWWRSKKRGEQRACAPQPQVVCASPAPTSLGLSPVGPLQFSLTQVNMHPSTGQGTHVLIFNYTACTEYIMRLQGMTAADNEVQWSTLKTTG